ncbi:hypothetical protein OIU85_010481 [Salix viminalis]|uniref:TF-B3 domain-containing protein n=1 Tax=Salix viminalis TaxID=40686 RepID=A0A9Q0NWM8_SALVM|nr:hypothetical protein OIU85_010481 [Salix viminalis]
MKPVLSKGWLRFASRKKLKVGDRIEFYEARNQTTDESPPCYGVRVKEKSSYWVVVLAMLHCCRRSNLSDFISHESRLPCFRPVQTHHLRSPCSNIDPKTSLDNIPTHVSGCPDRERCISFKESRCIT